MIEFQNVVKSYGKTPALCDLSLQIKQQGIYCLLGRNGAGKTTLLKSLAGHIPITSGRILVNGQEVTPLAMPDSIHYVESEVLHFDLKLDQLFQAAADINPKFDLTFAISIADRFLLDRKKRYHHLSFGMKSMVNTLLAIASGRDILLLDEPVLGFDPVMRKRFYDMLLECNASQPRIIIISTHIIDEISKVADQLMIIHKGQLIHFSGMDQIDEMAYCITGLAAPVRAATKGLHILCETRAGGFLTQSIYDKRIHDSRDYSISSLSLQDFFVGLVGNDEEELNENRN